MGHCKKSYLEVLIFTSSLVTCIFWTAWYYHWNSCLCSICMRVLAGSWASACQPTGQREVCGSAGEDGAKDAGRWPPYPACLSPCQHQAARTLFKVRPLNGSGLIIAEVYTACFYCPHYCLVPPNLTSTISCSPAWFNLKFSFALCCLRFCCISSCVLPMM